MTLEDPKAVWPGTNQSQPGKGTWFVLNYHHDGESHWCNAEQIHSRLRTIREDKPEEERPSRLKALGFVPYSKTVAETTAKYQTERAAIDAKYQTEWAALDAKIQTERAAIYAKYQTEWAAIDAKYQTEWAALDAKIQTERAAIYAKYQTEWAAFYAKIQTERAALYAKAAFSPILTVEEWEEESPA
jgi:hypothetical protein